MNRATTVSDVARLYRFDQYATILPSPRSLTPAHREQFRQDGFLAVEGVLSPDEVATAKTALDDLIHERVPGYAGLLQPEPEFQDIWATLSVGERADRIRKVWRFVGYEARLKALGEAHTGILTILEALLGESVQMIQDMALLKPPHFGTEKPWHQDAAYFGWSPPEKIIGVWIALDEATPENGCMHVIPGTHRSGPVPHTHDRDCQIPDARVAVEGDVLVPLSPGGVLFFSSLLHHGTPPNNSANRRWALQYHYAAISCQPIDRRQHATLFFEEGRYQGCRGQIGKFLDELEP
jgi:phytanoyl-CoA hydroxylase